MGQDRVFNKRRQLLASTTVGLILAAAGGAWAQGSAAPVNALEEVVVTATRQTDTVNRVPLSITAETQRTMDQRGIRNIGDLTSLVPSLQINQVAPGVAQVAIRGISNVGVGAATTGFYLDDVPLQKRTAGGGVATNAGSPLPPLFDLERVEVLRGPQGTLFGGSSEGGTIRYITPQPSFTRYSAYVRGEASTTDGGAASYEGGAAVGGPIIQDKLAFRASVWARHSGGYMDLIDPNSTGNVVEQSNVNYRDTRMIRGALAWRPVDPLTITLSYFSSRDHSNDVVNNYTGSTGAISQPSLTYNTNISTAGCPAFPPMLGPAPVAVNGIATGCGGGVPGTPFTGTSTYTRPGFSRAGYTLGPGKILDTQGLMPATTSIDIPSLTIDYNFPDVTVKSITSFVHDISKSVTPDALSQLVYGQQGALVGSQVILHGLLNAGPAYPFPGFADNGRFYGRNNHYQINQEIRLSSAGDAKPLSWVAGIFFSNSRIRTLYENYYNPSLDALDMALYGVPAVQVYGTPAFDPAGRPAGSGFDHKQQSLNDTEIAGFAEANYWITDKIRATAGIRVSRVSFNYYQLFYGPINGFNLAGATNTNGGISTGNTTESPITPKFGLQYQLSSNDLLYVSAAKGFRAGGVNTLLPLTICGNGLALYGLKPTDVPTEYKSDSVWNYEAGAKLRVLENRVQLNASVYRIDWSGVQLTGSPGAGCGIPFTTNAGNARSQGIEIEFQARLFDNLNVNIAVAYDDAQYTQDAAGLTGSTGRKLILAYAGQKFDLPPITVSIGARYDFQVNDQMKAYVRGDYRFASHIWGGSRSLPVLVGGVPSNPSYNPDYIAKTVQQVNLRAGVEYKDLDFNVFVNNLFNQVQGPIAAGGRNNCFNASCSAFYFDYTPQAYTMYQPRQIGVQIAYRH